MKEGCTFPCGQRRAAPRTYHAISTSAFCPAIRPKWLPPARSPHGPWWLPELLLGRRREQGRAQRVPSKFVGALHRAVPQNLPLAQRLPHTSDGPPHLPRRLCVGRLLNRARLFATSWTLAHQVPLSTEFSRHWRTLQEH